MAIPNEALQKLVREIETQAVAAQQQIGLARTQITAKQREQRLVRLTLSEMASLPEDAVVYEGVGKMYVLAKFSHSNTIAAPATDQFLLSFLPPKKVATRITSASDLRQAPLPVLSGFPPRRRVLAASWPPSRRGLAQYTRELFQLPLTIMSCSYPPLSRPSLSAVMNPLKPDVTGHHPGQGGLALWLSSMAPGSLRTGAVLMAVQMRESGANSNRRIWPPNFEISRAPSGSMVVASGFWPCVLSAVVDVCSLAEGRKTGEDKIITVLESLTAARIVDEQLQARPLTKSLLRKLKVIRSI
ncbi:hypothetical protein ACJZ2D_008354 [Fusarium nematophilum]